MNDDNIPLSYLAQYYFCPRRAALLMLEQVWNENEYTAEGRVAHERVHTSRIEKRGDFIKVYELSVTSNIMKLSGKCDCIEANKDSYGYFIPFLEGKYCLYPIEYKHGIVRDEVEYNIQLCAQAMCLEEMFNCKIENGAIFYIDSHRRVDVFLSDELREKVKSGSDALQDMQVTQQVPIGDYSPKCKKCSLLDYCQPKIKGSNKEYFRILQKMACSLEDEDEKA